MPWLPMPEKRSKPAGPYILLKLSAGLPITLQSEKTEASARTPMKFPIGCHSGRIVAGLLAGSSLAFSQIAPVARMSQDQIRDINQQIRVEGNAAVINGLLKERAHLLTDLMEKNPRAAVESALPDELRQDLASRVPDAEPLLEEKGEWTGPLVTTVADDLPTPAAGSHA